MLTGRSHPLFQTASATTAATHRDSGTIPRPSEPSVLSRVDSSFATTSPPYTNHVAPRPTDTTSAQTQKSFEEPIVRSIIVANPSRIDIRAVAAPRGGDELPLGGGGRAASGVLYQREDGGSHAGLLTEDPRDGLGHLGLQLVPL